MNQIKAVILSMLFIFSLTGCSIKINQSFDNEQLISPEQIQSDIGELKKNLNNKHFNIDWEGKKASIFEALDNIKNTDSYITIDSFENQLKRIIDNIDDGHSGVIHQDSFKIINRNLFGYQSLSESISYVRLGSFMYGELMTETLEKLTIDFKKNNNKALIIDIRSNYGGAIHNVKKALSYFLPTKTKIYESVEVAKKSGLLPNLNLSAWNANLKRSRHTDKKKIDADPKIYLWVDDSIASGSLLFSYHIQKHGAFVIGEAPKGLFNTFGNPIGYQLRHSKVIYLLAHARVHVTNEKKSRIDDMLQPDYIPEEDWSISDLVKFINSRE